MPRMLLLLALVVLITSCCVAKTSKKDQVKCTLWQAGQATEPAESDSLAAVAIRLLATADDELRLIVTPEMVQEILANDSALEIVFPAVFTADTAFGVKQEINRILIPLSGEYGPPEDMASAIILFGDDNGYITGPNQNNLARPDMLRLLELLKL